MNSIDTQENFTEAQHYFEVFDCAQFIDESGVVVALREIVRYMNNPQEQHVMSQLLRIAEKYEHVLLKMDNADEVLKP